MNKHVYDGDGNKEEFVISISAGRSFEGYHDPEDKAQALIGSLRFKTGEGRRVWYKEVSADGKKQFEGLANVSDIKIGGGDATDYEEFGCTIRWVGAPKESAVVG